MTIIFCKELLMKNTKNLVITAVFIALGVVLPLLFHSIPKSGSILLPMHIPVLLCGLVCGWPYGLACGILTPLLSSQLTGMPPAEYLLPMLVELAIYGFIAGILLKLIRTKNTFLDLYISLIGAMLCGRIAYGLLNALILNFGKYSFAAWTASAFVTSLPGILIQLAIIPIIVFALERAKLIPKRYA